MNGEYYQNPNEHVTAMLVVTIRKITRSSCKIKEYRRFCIVCRSLHKYFRKWFSTSISLTVGLPSRSNEALVTTMGPSSAAARRHHESERQMQFFLAVMTNWTFYLAKWQFHGHSTGARRIFISAKYEIDLK